MLKRSMFNILAVLFVIINIAPAALAAQPPVNLQISPLPILLNTKPGTETSADLRVRNAASVPVQLKASIKTFSVQGSDGHIVFHNPGPSDDFVHWINFDRSVFNAPAGQWQTIHMSINVPKEAAFGYYWAVQFEPAAGSAASPGAATLRGAVAIFVLLNADAPGAKRTIKVTNFSVDHHTYEFLPVNFKVSTRNSGNTHVAPGGNIFISKGSKQIAVLSINPSGGYVIPGANRTFTSSWSDGFPVYKPSIGEGNQPQRKKDGSIKQHLTWNFSQVPKLRFGHYRASLLLVYNDGARDIPVSGSVYFWVIPWRLIITVLAFIALVAGLVTYVIVLRRRLKQAGGHHGRGKR